ncbi:GNAT family N-acetyltransferase [Paenibacillus dokdonensis]|uniref:GNAT family N-acetyltransferase n=1 Tax=Paenibacillus dokdonensis TaxID=2567944 RepID=A0ABU6GRK5_9BACL|nr:GNAT family N-acetyltransferase [Paenibacillus dokdonensis]MEC0242343.1 GNAT family N-acetyltransferase [Paenibacillus dokdonensis]
MRNQKNDFRVLIKPWDESNLNLLYLLNTPQMLEHLGGPEAEEQVIERHKRYIGVAETGTGCMFSIMLAPHDEPVGNVGYWESVWQEETIYEIGWGILPPFQNQGIATAATTAAIASAREQKKYRYMHAFPSVDNPASNGICRKLGFTLISECDFEYPKGSFLRCNNWRLDLKSHS